MTLTQFNPELINLYIGFMDRKNGEVLQVIAYLFLADCKFQDYDISDCSVHRLFQFLQTQSQVFLELLHFLYSQLQL